MTEIEQILNQFLSALAEEIKSDIPVVSGKTTREIEVRTQSIANGFFARVSGQLVAPSYIYTFEHGRPPTVNGNKGGQTLQQAIQKWIELKGFRWTKAIKQRDGSLIIKAMTTKQMSWAIAIKIHREGNKMFRNLRGGRSGIISDPVNEKRIDTFVEAFSDKAGRLLLSQVIQNTRIKK